MRVDPNYKAENEITTPLFRRFFNFFFGHPLRSPVPKFFFYSPSKVRLIHTTVGGDVMRSDINNFDICNEIKIFLPFTPSCFYCPFRNNNNNNNNTVDRQKKKKILFNVDEKKFSVSSQFTRIVHKNIKDSFVPTYRNIFTRLSTEMESSFYNRFYNYCELI